MAFKNTLPVTPTYGTPPTSKEELALRVLDLSRMCDSLVYDQVRAAYIAGFVDLPAYEQAANQRGECCLRYICQYVDMVLLREIQGRMLDPATKVISDIVVNLALESLAKSHPDTTVRYLANWGKFGVVYQSGIAQLVWEGLHSDAPEAEVL